MFRNNHITPAFILVFLVFVFLIGVSFLPSDLSIFGIEIKPVDLFSELKQNDDELNYTFTSLDRKSVV